MKSLLLTDTNDGYCTVVAVSDLSGNVNTRLLSCTTKEIVAWQRSGELIQRALPQLSKEEREFLLTGSTPEEWDAAFGGEEA